MTLGDSEVGKSKREQSLARKDKGFTVEASPFNVVKVDLAIILFVGIVLLVIHESLSGDPAVQIGVLGLYGLGSMFYVMMKVRKVASGIDADNKGVAGRHPSGDE